MTRVAILLLVILWAPRPVMAQKASGCYENSRSFIYPLGGEVTDSASAQGVWLVLSTDPLTPRSQRLKARAVSLVLDALDAEVILVQEGTWRTVGDSIEVSTHDVFTTNWLMVALGPKGRLMGRGSGTTDEMVPDSAGGYALLGHEWMVRLDPVNCDSVPKR